MTEYIDMLPRRIITNLFKKALESYKEKWDLFKFNDVKTVPLVRMSKENTRDGLLNLLLADVQAIATSLGVSVPSDDMKIEGHRTCVKGAKDKTILAIWNYLSNL